MEAILIQALQTTPNWLKTRNCAECKKLLKTKKGLAVNRRSGQKITEQPVASPRGKWPIWTPNWERAPYVLMIERIFVELKVWPYRLFARFGHMVQNKLCWHEVTQWNF